MKRETECKLAIAGNILAGGLLYIGSLLSVYAVTANACKNYNEIQDIKSQKEKEA